MKKLKHVDGLKELDAMLDGLIDPKFRARALRTAARETMKPVETALKSKLPAGGEEKLSYKHYGADGYSPGDLRNGTKITIRVNSNKAIKQNSSGEIKKNSRNELWASVGFKSHLVKLANILEHGRSRRVASTEDGKVFHVYGNPTDMTERDIGTFDGKGFVLATELECEAKMVNDFKVSLTASVEREARRLNKPRRKKKER